MNYDEIVTKIKKLQFNYDRAIKRKADQRAKRYMNEIKLLRAQAEAFEQGNHQEVIAAQAKTITELEEQLEGASELNQGLQEEIAKLNEKMNDIVKATEPEPEVEEEPKMTKCTRCEHMIEDEKMADHQANCIAKTQQ